MFYLDPDYSEPPASLKWTERLLPDNIVAEALKLDPWKRGFVRTLLDNLTGYADELVESAGRFLSDIDLTEAVRWIYYRFEYAESRWLWLEVVRRAKKAIAEHPSLLMVVRTLEEDCTALPHTMVGVVLMGDRLALVDMYEFVDMIAADKALEFASALWFSSGERDVVPVLLAFGRSGLRADTLQNVAENILKGLNRRRIKPKRTVPEAAGTIWDTKAQKLLFVGACRQLFLDETVENLKKREAFMRGRGRRIASDVRSHMLYGRHDRVNEIWKTVCRSGAPDRLPVAVRRAYASEFFDLSHFKPELRRIVDNWKPLRPEVITWFVDWFGVKLPEEVTDKPEVLAKLIWERRLRLRGQKEEELLAQFAHGHPQLIEAIARHMRVYRDGSRFWSIAERAPAFLHRLDLVELMKKLPDQTQWEQYGASRLTYGQFERIIDQGYSYRANYEHVLNLVRPYFEGLSERRRVEVILKYPHRLKQQSYCLADPADTLWFKLPLEFMAKEDWMMKSIAAKPEVVAGMEGPDDVFVKKLDGYCQPEKAQVRDKLVNVLLAHQGLRRRFITDHLTRDRFDGFDEAGMAKIYGAPRALSLEVLAEDLRTTRTFSGDEDLRATILLEDERRMALRTESNDGTKKEDAHGRQ